MLEKEEMNEIFDKYREYDKDMDLIRNKIYEINNIIEGKMNHFYTVVENMLIKYFDIDKNEKNYIEIDNLITKYLFSEEYGDKNFEDLEKEIQLIRSKN